MQQKKSAFAPKDNFTRPQQSSKENIDSISPPSPEIAPLTEHLQNLTLQRTMTHSGVPFRTKPPPSQLLESQTKQRPSSFSRLKSSSLSVNYFDFYKKKKEFKLLSDAERDCLIEDLFEADKCFYLNQFNMKIHSSHKLRTDDGKLNRQ